MPPILDEETVDFLQNADQVNQTGSHGDHHGGGHGDHHGGHHDGGHGDETFLVSHDGGQKHTYAGGGDDIIEMYFERVYENVFEQGNHARGDIANAAQADGFSGLEPGVSELRYNPNDRHNPINFDFGFDRFIFSDTANVVGTTTVIGRFEDFDFSRDLLFLDPSNLTDIEFNHHMRSDNALDFYNLPSNVSVVRFNGQFNDYDDDPQLWIRIVTGGGGVIFYALEGARVDMNGDGQSNPFLGNGPDFINQEAHFLAPGFVSYEEIMALEAVDFVDPMNFVPQWYEDLFPERDTYQDVDARYQQVYDNEKIIRTDAAEGIAGGLNDDWIEALGGDDHVWGGSGHDMILGGDGNDHLWGNSGRDTIDGGAENDVIHGGLGNDSVSGGMGDDSIDGEDGDDHIEGNAGNDTLTGGAGSDTFAFQSSDTGTDTILDFQINSDILMLDGAVVAWGDETVLVSGGTNGVPLSLTLGSQTVLLTGVTMEDWLPAAPMISITGTDIVDVLIGGDNAEEILGNGGDDMIQGDDGDDALSGGDGNDTIYGGAGNDTIDGGDGDDFLEGNGGENLLTGGLGSDTFAFSSQTTGTHTITDFEIGTDVLFFDGLQVKWGDYAITTSGGGNGQALSITLGSHTVLLEGVGIGDWQQVQRVPRPDPKPVLEEKQTITGTDDGEILKGHAGADTILGLGGDDFVYGQSGGDTVYGGAGNDVLRGNGGDDELRGGSGDDRLIGHSGDDVLIGGTGKDVLSGGDGADRFIFRESDVAITAWTDDSAIDMILDLDLAVDTIRLDFADTSQSVGTYFGVWANQSMDYEGETYEGVLMRLKGADGIADNQFIFIAGDHTKTDLLDIVEIV
ncbi:calcium-binding protein [Shimia ponticola]|uniref:calcium-binding protein n=1 Tax=Shimia ponticola TaxID=2582893 RepID=UPI0011BF1873|nr:calcium-binding protein [Shimia ponticola]